MVNNAQHSGQVAYSVPGQEQLKERFSSALLSSISHDFKTPLAAIIGSLSAVRHMRDMLNEETRDSLIEVAQEEAERLNVFITNLLNMTKLESGTVQLNCQWHDPEEVAARVIRRMQFGLTHHHVECHMLGQAALFRMDAILIEQVLQNLLDNAVKYSPEGSRVQLFFHSVQGRGHIIVKDQGCGIVPEHRAQVFEKFFRSDALRKQTGGAGLGLAICHSIIEAHNGTMMIEHNPEQADVKYPGTVFHIWLPEAKLK